MDNGSPLNNDGSMTLTEHLGELRTRILHGLAALTAGTCISGAFIDEIIAVLTAPAANLYYMRPAEAFFIYIKVALACGVLIAAPVLFYELWAFLVPALTGKERTTLLLFVPASVLLFWAGIAFAYFFVFPQGLNFFTSFAGGNIAPMLSIESYLDFFLMLVVPFGFIFNLPMVLIVLAQMGAVSSLLLKRGRKYMVLASFILAAIITPTPDVITQTLLAVPMILLYEGSRVFNNICAFKPRFHIGGAVADGAAAAGAEGDDGFAAEIIAAGKGGNSHRRGVPPDGVAYKNNVILRNIADRIFQRRAGIIRFFLFGNFGYFAVNIGIRRCGFDFKQIAAGFALDYLCKNLFAFRLGLCLL